MNKSHLCPEWETLSAGHDGQPGTEWVRLHAQECAACRRELEVLRRLDEAIASTPACDEATLARIKAGTRRKLRQPRFVLFSWPMAWRAVAGIAVFGTVLVLHQVLRQAPADDGLLAALPPAQAAVPAATENTVREGLLPPVKASSPPVSAPLAFGPWLDHPLALPDATGKLVAAPPPATDAAAPRPAPVPTDGGVKLGDTRLVAIGTPGTKPGRPRGQEDSISPPPEREVADYVWHVWLVDDPGKALAELQQLLPNNQAEFQRLISEQRDRYLLQLMISDRNLEGLVDRLHQQGSRLLSPAAPQPGVSGLRLSGKAVQYEVDFVRR